MTKHADRDRSEPYWPPAARADYEPVDLTGFEDAYANAPHAGAGGQGDPVDEQRHQRTKETTMPKRIQRKRAKGWKMPEGAIYVGRPSKWGNPWQIKRLSSWEFVGLNPDGSEAIEGWGGRAHAAHWAVNQFALHIGPMGNYEYDAETLAELRAHLAGHDLACWCPLDLPCHADVLLEMANP